MEDKVKTCATPESATGVIHHKEQDYAYVSCPELGNVFLSDSTWNGTQRFEDVEQGIWIDLVAKNHPRRNSQWTALTAQESTFSWAFRHGGDTKTLLIIDNIDALVTHIGDDFMMLWSELLGRIMVQKKLFDRTCGAGSMKLLDAVLVNARSLKSGTVGDVAWKACWIEKSTNKTKWSYIEVKARLTELNTQDRSGILSAPGYSEIFMTHLDYSQHCVDGLQFNKVISSQKYFKAFIVPSQKHCQCPWRAIFIEPWEVEKVSDDQQVDLESDFGSQLSLELELNPNSPPDSYSSNSVAFEKGVSVGSPSFTKESEVQTDPLSEWSWLKQMHQDPQIYQRIRNEHTALLRQIKLVITGKHRSINTIKWCNTQDKSSHTSEYEHNGLVNTSAQTSELLEKEIITKLMNDTEIDSYLEENYEQLWTQLFEYTHMC